MGVNVPPLKPKKYHRVVIGLTGPLSPGAAKALKRDLDRVLDRHRKKVWKVTPGPVKKSSGASAK
jgi:hypothetical protein